MTTETWQPVTVSLPYRLGEIELFSISFSGFANRQHITAVKPYTELPKPAAEFDHDSTFIFYPNYPVAFTPERVVISDRWIVYTPYTFKNYYVDLKRIGSFDAYLKSFSAKTRSTLKRKVNKFAQANGGQLNWREFTKPEEMDEFFALATAVSSKTYQERLLRSGLPSSPEFVAAAKARAAARGVHGYILFLNDKAVSYAFCFCSDGIVTYDYVGYDPQEQSLSAGTVLQYCMMQSLFEQKDVAIFDFTEGEGQQKMIFGTEALLCAKSYFLRRTLVNRALVNIHYGLNRFVESVGLLLDKWGFKARLRKLIRRAA